ncbi:uncharacterized protein MYCFIDRAFT_63047 [Pseudocercospora fijiensis CIRAD86]|uniref:Uncharacterized protein n=1 Tax=Pseudocercospora fijiensis (strain CIRAD86) TaxID=383855 RepID=N1Q9F3_PSEFD|nr:uncharacterized protein MYCFIDRAFT_63047 [Pseudocercospora fijiensis CIRAD86]EME89504.1 hypothetical protein MYCFIDRAFT_63047 [Pseudocercospora fijiensis CIRAD86]
MRIRCDDDLFSEDFTPAAQPVVVPQTQPTHAQPPRTAPDSARGRGRGRGRGRNVNEARDTTERIETTGQGRQPQKSRNARPQQQAQPQSAPPENAPSGPRKETPQAVRGDRSAAGGLPKPKLTEEELAEKMARIQIKNASLTAAHARAEADAASFAEREQQAKQIADQRKKEERRDRQQMMGEREKNRQRKLKAMEGREWDAEKREDDFGKGGRFDKKGGFAGDREDYDDGREYLYQEPRGGGRGRGSGRGGRGGRLQEQHAPRPEEFPALPASKVEKLDQSKTLPDTRGPSGGSWAEQMESSAQ